MPDPTSTGEEAGSERRQHARRSIQLRALVLLPDDQLLNGQTVDISAGGACLSTPTQLLVDDECRLQLELEAAGTHRAALLVCRVCYCMPQGDRFRVGLQFVQMNEADAELIAALLR